MARVMAKAVVGFGLVSVPVDVYSAVESESKISFNMLHSKCGSRLHQDYVCEKEGVKVSRDETVKGYEFAKDQYVMFSKEELDSLEADSTKAIEITEFVPAGSVDPVYFSKPYFLGPSKNATNGYWLLWSAMEKSGRVALAKYAIRGNQYLVLIRSTDDGLYMHQLMYADQIRSFTEFKSSCPQIKPDELKLALRLVDSKSSDSFSAADYHDEVRERMQEQIDRKVKTGENVTTASEKPMAPVADIMDALRKSLEEGPKMKVASSKKMK